MTLLCFTILPTPSPSYLHINNATATATASAETNNKHTGPRINEAPTAPSQALLGSAAQQSLGQVATSTHAWPLDAHKRIDSISQPTVSATQPIENPEPSRSKIRASITQPTAKQSMKNTDQTSN